MMPSRVLEENGRAHFMVRRFDRLDDGTKVHLQSLCAIDHRDLKPSTRIATPSTSTSFSDSTWGRMRWRSLSSLRVQHCGRQSR